MECASACEVPADIFGADEEDGKMYDVIEVFEAKRTLQLHTVSDTEKNCEIKKN